MTSKDVLRKCDNPHFEKKECDARIAVYRMRLSYGNWKRDLVLDVIPGEGMIKFNIRENNVVDDSCYDAIAPLCEGIGFVRRNKRFELSGKVVTFSEMVNAVNAALRRLAERKNQFISLMVGDIK